MTDEKTVTEVMQPQIVTIVGTGDGGITRNTTATTPPDQPNLVVNVVSPLVAVLVRGGNLYVTTLVGLVAAAMSPQGGALLYTSDFWHMLLTCANLAIPVVGLGVLKDVATIFGKLEHKFPLLTGGV